MTIVIKHWRINPEDGSVVNLHSNEIAKLEPKTIAVLQLLVERYGQVVSRDEFMQVVWGGSFTVEESLTRCISELRKMFGDSPRSSEYIKTVHKKGYQLIAKPNIEKNTKNILDAKEEQVGKTGLKLTTLVFSALLCAGVLTLLSWFNNGQKDKVVQTETNIATPKNEISSQIYSNIISSANAQSNFLVQSPATAREYQVLISPIDQANQAVRRVRIEVKDNSDNVLWNAVRDYDSEMQRTIAANDLTKVFGFLDTSQPASEISSLPDVMQKQYQQALYYIDKRGKENLLKAIDIFESILDKRADFVMATINQAVASRILGLYETDEQSRQQSSIKFELLLKQAMAVAPDHPVAKAMTARFNPESQNWNKYEAVLNRAVDYAPECMMCVRQLAEFYLNLGYYDKAATTIENHMMYFPLSVTMHSFLGVIYSMQGNIEKTRYQADTIDALAATKGFDAMSVRVQVAMMEGNLNAYHQLTQSMLDVHPSFSQRLQVMNALINSELQHARQLMEKSPVLDFNLAVSARMFDAVISRIQNNVNNGRLRDLSLVHGWLLPDTYIHPSYIENIRQLKNTPEVYALFDDIGLFTYWQTNGQWPDYCQMQQYERHRPEFCPS